MPRLPDCDFIWDVSFLTTKERLLIVGIVSIFVLGGAVKLMRGQNGIDHPENVSNNERLAQNE
ncbi:MAG: hypothetical protein AAGA58_07710 [Verrucomicrobiota bacterium]